MSFPAIQLTVFIFPSSLLPHHPLFPLIFLSYCHHLSITSSCHPLQPIIFLIPSPLTTTPLTFLYLYLPLQILGHLPLPPILSFTFLIYLLYNLYDFLFYFHFLSHFDFHHALFPFSTFSSTFLFVTVLCLSLPLPLYLLPRLPFLLHFLLPLNFTFFALHFLWHFSFDFFFSPSLFAFPILLVKLQTDYKLYSSGWHKQGIDFSLTGNRLQLLGHMLEPFPVPSDLLQTFTIWISIKPKWVSSHRLFLILAGIWMGKDYGGYTHPACSTSPAFHLSVWLNGRHSHPIC